MTNYYNPVKIIRTKNWLLKLKSSIKYLKISSPIIVTSPGNRKRLNIDAKFNSESIFSDIDSNTNIEHCIFLIICYFN